MKSIAILMSAALLLGAGPQEVEDYARREVESRQLEEFRGGFHGAILILIGLVLGGLIASSFEECELCGRSSYEELPPWEGPRPAPPVQP